MATYLYWSGGDNSSGTEAGGWAAAKNTFAGAVALATASGDVIKVHKTSQENHSASTNYTLLNNISIIVVDKDNSDALSEMGEGGWIGSNVSWSSDISGAYKVRIHGLTIKQGGGLSRLNLGDGGSWVLTNILIWCNATTQNLNIQIGNTNNNHTHINGLKIKTDRTTPGAHSFVLAGNVEINNLTTEMASTVSASMIKPNSSAAQQEVVISDSNLSALGYTYAILSASTVVSQIFRFYRCKFAANYVLFSPTGNKSFGVAIALDCSSGDTHGLFQYVDAFGSIVSDSAIYFTSGAAGQSWKIVTTANCSQATPFVTPWIPVYHTDTSAITPRFEILRDGSTTAYQTDEIGAEFSAKVTSDSVIGTTYSDYMPLLGTAANQAAGAGTGSWTGESGTAWSGKIDAGSALTPAENGEILGRALVGEPSITVYLDPEIRW